MADGLNREFASHSKKRPHNLVIGRMYDYHLYDMLEVGVTRHVSIQQLKGGGKLSPQVGFKERGPFLPFPHFPLSPLPPFPPSPFSPIHPFQFPIPPLLRSPLSPLFPPFLLFPSFPLFPPFPPFPPYPSFPLFPSFPPFPPSRFPCSPFPRFPLFPIHPLPPSPPLFAFHPSSRSPSPQVGSKPCFCFIGTEFDNDPAAVQLKSLLLDYFRGEVAATVDLAGLDRVFVCAAQNGKVSNEVFCNCLKLRHGDEIRICLKRSDNGTKVLFRHCAIRLKRSGTKVPRVVLVPIGPSIDFEIRRTRLPGEELRKEAMRAVKLGQEKKVRRLGEGEWLEGSGNGGTLEWAWVRGKIKNVKSDIIKGKVGRIYMPKQEVGSMSLMKMKGLKRERREAAATRKKAKQDAPAKGGEGRGGEAADGGAGAAQE
ncbi:unnamed protein product [Closterium sp. NIES-65]|nr:unnamed protein product [Closterium sp. NIES-65]